MRFKRLVIGTEGAAMVEFAITVPLLLLVVWIIVDFARAYYTSNSLSSAVREGARVSAVQPTPSSAANLASMKTRVKSAFNAFGGPGITDAEIVLYDSSTATPASVTVEVQNYPWVKTTPITVFTGGQILMTRRAKFRYEREAN
jgi:Flp pilus assembly protein TadG